LKDKLKRITMEFITNPIILIVYWVFFYELATLCMYGRYDNNIYIVMACIIYFIINIIFYILRSIKNKEYKSKLSNSKPWKCISIIIIIVITSFYGVKIYKSATNYGGKLARVIERVKNERNVKFEKNNIYEYGVKGIFEDINKKIELPKKLYLVNDLNIKFEKDGTITSLYTFIYGKDKNGKDASYLITYDKNKSTDIKLILNGTVNADYSNNKLLDPLFETVNCISIKDTVSKWNASKFGLLYKGKRNWEGNREGIVLVNKNGNEVPTDLAGDKLVGYTVSIYVPGKEDQITPVRYNLLTDSYWFKFLNTETEDKLEESKKELDFVTGNSNSNDEFYLKDGVRYRLNVEDKATGSFFYSLQQTTDGGNKWVVLNDNPFNGAVGEASGIYFIDENIGFIGASRNDGSEGELYRSDDGGKFFNKLEFESKSVTLDNGAVINPFDFPKVPYEKDGKLYLNIEQGADGDYNGNSSLLYSSKDKGKTWEYVKEVKSSN
jgi:hypothetical protein